MNHDWDIFPHQTVQGGTGRMKLFVINYCWCIA